MDIDQERSLRRSVLVISFWSFFTGLMVDQGIDRLQHGQGRLTWLFSFILAIGCAVGVLFQARRVFRRLSQW